MVRTVVNGLYLYQKLTGVQRYASEIVRVWRQQGLAFTICAPPPLVRSAILSHLWEQTWLPWRLPADAVLWAPTNTGPIYTRNQVITVHDGAVLSHPEWFSKAYSIWRSWALPRIMCSAKHVITVSRFAKERLCEWTGIPETKITTIPNGINHDLFRPSSASEVASIREKYTLGERYLLTVGSLDPRKNLGRLIQAWKRVEDADRRDTQLVIAGGGSAHFAAMSLASDSANVRILGRVPDQDLPALYSGALAFVYPSVFEGFGLPPLEAMACGTPVLTSNISSLPEVVGDAALFIDPYDINDIESGIERLSEDADIRDNLRNKGLARAALFTWEKTADQTWKLLHNVARI